MEHECTEDPCVTCNKTMTDIHQRFQEKFGPVDPEVLAFIDEIVRETELEAGYHTGREHERSALIEKVRELTIDGPNIVPYVETHDLLTYLRGEELCIFHKDKNCCAYDVKQRSGIQEKPFKDLGEFVNAPEEKKRKVMLEVAREATNDQRAQIGLPPLQEETEYRCFTEKGTIGCFHPIKSNCTHYCHKPRTEETDIPTCPHGLSTPFCPDCQETQKEGASFSGWEYNKYADEEFSAHYFYGDIEIGEGGRWHLCTIGSGKEDENAQRVVDYINFLTDIIAYEVPYERFAEWREKNPLSRPKENPTPQSREQGGEVGKCAWCKYAVTDENWKEHADRKCEKTNQ